MMGVKTLAFYLSGLNALDAHPFFPASVPCWNPSLFPNGLPTFLCPYLAHSSTSSSEAISPASFLGAHLDMSWAFQKNQVHSHILSLPLQSWCVSSPTLQPSPPSIPPPHPSRASQSTKLSSMCYIAAARQLSKRKKNPYFRMGKRDD